MTEPKCRKASLKKRLSTPLQKSYTMEKNLQVKNYNLPLLKKQISPKPEK